MTAPAAITLVSTHAEYDHLFDIYVPIATGVFALVLFAVVYAIVRYRRNSTPSRRNGLQWMEGSYAVLLTLMVGFLLYETFTAEHRVDTVAERERPSLVVNVTAARWEWEFNYPRYDITAHSGFVGYQPLVVPADEAIRFQMTSQDVIHSMYIPALNFKRDLIHGTVERVTLTFTQLGTFDGACNQFCGLRHAEMVFHVIVLRPAAFSAWAAAHRGDTST